MLGLGVRVITARRGPFSLEAVAILVDAWRQSTLQPAHIVQDMPSRLNWVLREAGFACSHSILVGISGFLACASSQWLPTVC